MSRFSITNGKGFNLTFANKWQISVQWGPGNYCERENEDFDLPKKQKYWVSGSAEVAVWKGDGKRSFVPLQFDSVEAFCSTNKVAEMITIVSNAKSTISNKQMSNKLKKVWR